MATSLTGCRKNLTSAVANVETVTCKTVMPYLEYMLFAKRYFTEQIARRVAVCASASGQSQIVRNLRATFTLFMLWTKKMFLYKGEFWVPGHTYLCPLS